MRRIVACVVIALFCLSVPLAVQADNAAAYKALEAKAMQFAAEGVRSLAQDGGYQYAAVFPYSVNDAEWSTQLAVYNFSGVDSDLMIGCYDVEGEVAFTGTFSLGPNALKVGPLSDFLTDGEVPFRGSIGIFGTQMFYGNLSVGNMQGGFGMIEKGAEPY